MSLVERQEQPPPSVVADPLAIVARLAENPNVDPDKLVKLYELAERARAARAKEAFNAALAAMQPELPTINRGGKVVVYSKADREYAAKNNGEYPPNAVPQQSTPYARIEDITEATRAPMAAYGFAYSARVDTLPDGRIKVTGILSHKDGHSEETSFPLPHDSSGSKNNVQAIGSSITYGRRYAMLALLNIVSHAPQDRDDDGTAAGAKATIDPDQIADIETRLRDTASDEIKFLAWVKAASVPEMTIDQYKKSVAMLSDKARRMSK